MYSRRGSWGGVLGRCAGAGSWGGEWSPSHASHKTRAALSSGYLGKSGHLPRYLDIWYLDINYSTGLYFVSSYYIFYLKKYLDTVSVSFLSDI